MWKLDYDLVHKKYIILLNLYVTYRNDDRIKNLNIDSNSHTYVGIMIFTTAQNLVHFKEKESQNKQYVNRT